jgi:hypothetical protein
LKHGRLCILSAMKVRITTSFGGEIQPSTPCRKIYGMLKILRKQNLQIILATFLPFSLLGVSAGIFETVLMDESGMIITQMRSTIDQIMARGHGTLCTISCRNNNQ